MTVCFTMPKNYASNRWKQFEHFRFLSVFKHVKVSLIYAPIRVLSFSFLLGDFSPISELPDQHDSRFRKAYRR